MKKKGVREGGLPLNTRPGRLSGFRIARISTVPFFVLTQLKCQIGAICASGAQVIVVTSDGPELAPLKAIEGVICKPVEIPRAISLWQDLLALLRLFWLFRHDGIDIAHSTTPKAGLLTAIAAFLAGVPVRLHTFTGQPWVGMRGVTPRLLRWSDWLIGRLNTRCYADSESQRQFLIGQRVISDKKLFVIGAGSLAGVDMRRFDPLRFPEKDRAERRLAMGIPEKTPVLLFVGRITADKGVRELMEAFQKLKAEKNTAHLILVGPLDPGSGVTQSVSRRDIEGVPDTHIIGYTEYPEEYMSLADILCLPSYREGFGTVVIEAAAMGLPTVGTDIYGLSDAVVNGQTGILVPPRDSTALANALATLLSDEKLRMSMGREARKRSEMLFDANQVNKKLIEECYNLLHRTR